MNHLSIVELDEIQSVITRASALDAVRASLRLLAAERALMLPEIGAQLPDGEFHVKGAYLSGSDHIAFKVASGFPANPGLGLPVTSGFSIALDAHTGMPAALLRDDGWLTQLRTAAAGALAAELLARVDASRVALLGAGDQAHFQLAALRDVRPIREVRVWNRTPGRALAFADRHADEQLQVSAADSVQEAVEHADIIVTATASTTPLLKREWLAPGAHVTAMGSDFEGKQELDLDVLAGADVLVADRVDVCMRVGELQHARSAGIDLGHVLEFADIVSGLAKGRQTPDQLTVIDQCGLGIYDAAMADSVLHLLKGSQ